MSPIKWAGRLYNTPARGLFSRKTLHPTRTAKAQRIPKASEHYHAFPNPWFIEPDPFDLALTPIAPQSWGAGDRQALQVASGLLRSHMVDPRVGRPGDDGVAERQDLVIRSAFAKKSVALSSCVSVTVQPNFGSIAAMSTRVAFPFNLLRT